MKSIWAIAAPVLMLSMAGPAVAENAAGHWLITGHVGGKDFTVDCKFQQAGDGLSGACVDGDTHDARVKGGRSHTLTKSHVEGDQFEFTYKSSYGLIPFEANYSGVIKGNHMTGVIKALGASGPFTAERS